MHLIELVSRNAEHRAYLDRVRAVGATSPSTALPRDRLPPTPDSEFRYLVDRGYLREGAPNTFYLFEPSFPTKQRLILVAVLWALLFGLPAVLVSLFG